MPMKQPVWSFFFLGLGLSTQTAPLPCSTWSWRGPWGAFECDSRHLHIVASWNLWCSVITHSSQCKTCWTPWNCWNLTSIYQSLVISSAEIVCSSFDLFRNCLLLIHWLLVIKLLTHSMSFCSCYYIPTWFCNSPSWFLTSFLTSGFLALHSHHPL